MRTSAARNPAAYQFRRTNQGYEIAWQRFRISRFLGGSDKQQRNFECKNEKAARQQGSLFFKGE
jgi:hypothetical protein